MVEQLYIINEGTRALNAGLYSQLRDNFPGGVIIANPGEGCHTSSQRRADGSYYTAIHHSGEYYRVNCPFCHDTRHRLWVNHMYGQPDAAGRSMKFLATCYNEQCLDSFDNRKRFHDSIFGFKNVSERRRQQFTVQRATWADPTQMGVVAPPGTIIPLSRLVESMPYHKAVTYLCGERRYTTQMLLHYDISYCTHSVNYPAAVDRIIFPIRMRDNLVGWQARYIGTTDWKTTPKYYGLPGMKKKYMLYNYDNAKDKPFVVLVEGATDCHVVGDYSVALLGKHLSGSQMELVLNTWAGKPIVLIFDPDAREDMRSTVADLQQCGAIVIEIVLPGNYDCGDYDRHTLWNIIYTQSRAMGVQLPLVA